MHVVGRCCVYGCEDGWNGEEDPDEAHLVVQCTRRFRSISIVGMIRIVVLEAGESMVQMNDLIDQD